MGPKTPPAFLEDYVAFSLANSIPTVIIIITNHHHHHLIIITTSSSLYQNFTELAMSLQIDTWHSPAIFNFLHQRPAVKISWNPPLAAFSRVYARKILNKQIGRSDPKMEFIYLFANYALAKAKNLPFCERGVTLEVVLHGPELRQISPINKNT